MINNIMNGKLLPICIHKSNPNGDFDEILLGRFARISFHRTLRIPEDGKEYPLPAGLGRFPIHRVEDYADKVPSEWLKEGGFFIPLHQREALFLEFDGPDWHPTIAKVCVGKINAITGKGYSENLSSVEQDYVVIPEQKWLDGIASGKGTVSQFVAMPLGQGYTIEAQITDEEKFGGFQIVGFDSIDGRFPERDPAIDERIREEEEMRRRYKNSLMAAPLNGLTFSLAGEIRYQSWDEDYSMGIAAGGSIKQQIRPDVYGSDSWDRNKKRSITIHIVNSLAYKAITGRDAPATPVTVEQYQKAKIPWYSHYDEKIVPVKPPSIFKRIMSIASIDAKRGKSQNHTNLEITPDLIKSIQTPNANQLSDIQRKYAANCFASLRFKEALRHINYVIDLDVSVTANDYVLRGQCNFYLKEFKDAEIDSSLAIEKCDLCFDAITLRARCRKEMGDHEGLCDDAEILIAHDDTKILGLEFRAEASILSGNFSNAIYEALYLKKKYPESIRADEILSLARDKNYAQIQFDRDQAK